MSGDSASSVSDIAGRGRHGSTFTEAFNMQNNQVETAIKSLDNLNDQIVQYIYNPGRRPVDHDYSSSHHELTSRDHETLKTSMSMMRHLLVDAQFKFRKMVDENRRLASRIDNSIQTANQEVKAIRDELEDTNKRLCELKSNGNLSQPTEGKIPEDIPEKCLILDNQEKEELETLREENSKLKEHLIILKDKLSHRKEMYDVQVQTSVDQYNVQTQTDRSSVLSETNVDNNSSPSVCDAVEDKIHAENCSRVEAPPGMDIVQSAEGSIHQGAAADAEKELAESPGGSIERTSLRNEHFREIQQQMVQAHQELSRAKEALLAMKSDRRRLQTEKLDLLQQLKQLYCTLEDKEGEIRDFIRNFELQMRESNETIKQLAVEKDDSEQEKWEILKKAREASERCVNMKEELDSKEDLIEQLKSQLAETREQLKNYDNQLKHNCNSSVDSTDQGTNSSHGHLKSSSVSVDSMLKSSSLDGNSPSSEELPPYQEIAPENLLRAEMTPTSKSLKSDSSHFSYAGRSLCHSLDQMTSPVGESTRASTELTSPLYVYNPADIKTVIDINRLPRKRRSVGAFSRLFGGKSRSRRSIAVSDPSIAEGLSSRESSPVRGLRRSHTVQFVGIENEGKNTYHMESLSPRLSMLTEDNYPAKLDALRQAREMGVIKWKAGHVLAWLEIDMNMPMYGKACSENIKSGKVLLGLSDSELDSALGLSSTIHRRKLRLAIEELRDSTTIQYPRAAALDHTWISHRWLPDLGLQQYSTNFEAQLVDGRLLNVLTKKDLEKNFGVQRRFHQTSLMFGIELLRRLKYNKEELYDRRSRCEGSDTDPLVWTNHRLIEWLRGIDLEEYSQGLEESGIHGALLVLDSSFNADAFASALNIPNTKSYVRRHLGSELDTLVRPARLSVEGSSKRSRSASSSTSLNRSFVRSYRGGAVSEDAQKGSTKRLSFRGSLGRALGRNKKDPAAKKNEEALSVDDSVLDVRKRCHSLELQGTCV